MTQADRTPVPGKDARGRFVAGNKLSKGRRGNRAKLGEKFLDALLAEWRRSGKKALERASGDDPVAFVKVVANLLPKEIAETININQSMRLNIEMATFSEAYDAWGRFLGAQPPAKLIEAKSNGDGSDEPSTD